MVKFLFICGNLMKNDTRNESDSLISVNQNRLYNLLDANALYIRGKVLLQRIYIQSYPKKYETVCRNTQNKL